MNINGAKNKLDSMVQDAEGRLGNVGGKVYINFICKKFEISPINGYRTIFWFDLIINILTMVGAFLLNKTNRSTYRIVNNSVSLIIALIAIYFICKTDSYMKEKSFVLSCYAYIRLILYLAYFVLCVIIAVLYVLMIISGTSKLDIFYLIELCVRSLLVFFGTTLNITLFQVISFIGKNPQSNQDKTSAEKDDKEKERLKEDDRRDDKRRDDRKDDRRDDRRGDRRKNDRRSGRRDDRRGNGRDNTDYYRDDRYYDDKYYDDDYYDDEYYDDYYDDEYYDDYYDDEYYDDRNYQDDYYYDRKIRTDQYRDGYL